MSILDGLRYLNIFLYGGIVSFVVLIVVVYTQSYLKLRKQGGYVALLPLHVVLIAVSYLLLATSALTNNVERLGTGFSYYIPLNAVGFIAGNVALYLIFGYKRRQSKALNGQGRSET